VRTRLPGYAAAVDSVIVAKRWDGFSLGDQPQEAGLNAPAFVIGADRSPPGDDSGR
jgi:hypothetical protein